MRQLTKGRPEPGDSKVRMLLLLKPSMLPTFFQIGASSVMILICLHWPVLRSLYLMICRNVEVTSASHGEDAAAAKLNIRGKMLRHSEAKRTS